MARERNRPFSFRDLDAEDWRSAQHYEWCELKYDGHFARIEIEGKQWRIYSSTDRVVEAAELPIACNRTTLWAEQMRGTEWACRHADLYERLAVFGSPMLDDKPQPYPHSAVTRRAVDKWLSRLRTPLDRLFLVDRWPMEEARKLWRHHVKKGDFEGMIFGGPHGLARMKAEATLDYVCMGFEQSDAASFRGWAVKSIIGGLYVRGKLERVTTVSGLTNEQRANFYQHPDRYIGRVFEAEGKRLFGNGKLRHPNFLRWRADKPAVDCKPPRKR